MRGLSLHFITASYALFAWSHWLGLYYIFNTNKKSIRNNLNYDSDHNYIAKGFEQNYCTLEILLEIRCHLRRSMNAIGIFVFYISFSSDASHVVVARYIIFLHVFQNIGLRRCGKSCRLRWTNYLRPDIKRGKFSLQEEQTIIQLHALLGNRYA